MCPGTFDFSAPDFFTRGGSGFLIAVGLLVYSCTGQSFVVVFSKEARNPKRNIPYAILITTGIILLIYTSIAMVDTGVLPISEVADKPLTIVARGIMPITLYYCFVIGGPIMALSTTLNTSFSIFTRPIHQMTDDGWFPRQLGKTNRFGAPYWILTIMYAISIIPIALDLSISVITSNLVLIGRVADLVAIVAVITLPKRIPEAWENRYFKSMNKTAFYGLMFFSLSISLLCLFISLGNISISNIYVAVGLALLFFTYATLRQKSGHVKMQKSYELQ
jgi:APA family basic amino acid/polyamine antiporter